MRARVVVAAQPGVEDLAVRAEELGLRSFWVNDTPMVHGDPFVALSLCAKAIRHIRLGIGVTSPALRSAPAAASACYTWTLPLPIQPRAGRTVCRHARRIGFSRSRSTVLPRRGRPAARSGPSPVCPDPDSDPRAGAAGVPQAGRRSRR